MRRLILFSDDYGLPQLLKHLPSSSVAGIVGAAIRPHQHQALFAFAESQHVLFFCQPRKTSPEYEMFVEQVRLLAPDLIIVHSYSMLLPPEILAIPTLGCINIHAALLPQYRGANPIQWAILNSETETGVTMHWMTDKFDTGDIIAQRRVPVYIDDTWRTILDRITVATDGLLATELPKVLNGTASRSPQDEAAAKHCRRRKPEDGQFTWQESVWHIHNLIRALVKPHPGAFFKKTDGQCCYIHDYLSLSQIASMKYSSMGGGMLKSTHIALSPISLDDLPDLYAWINDRDQVLMNKPYSPIHEGHHRDWFDAIHHRDDVIIFGIRLLKSAELSHDSVLGLGPLIGSCQLHSINYVHRSAELQIRIGDASAQGMGYGTQATGLLLDFAFRDLNLHRVYLHVFANNERAIRMYEKIGFVREGIMRKMAHIDGVYIDAVLMGILREEYQNA